MAPVTNQNTPTADKMTLIFGIFGIILAFLGVVVAIQTWRSHHQNARGPKDRGNGQ